MHSQLCALSKHAIFGNDKERARTERQRTMSDPERIKLLEKALIKYVELYGFIDEAREYYIRNADGKVAVSEQKH